MQNYAKNKVGYANERSGCVPTLGDTPLGFGRLCVPVKVVCPRQVPNLLTLPLTLTTSYLASKKQPDFHLALRKVHSALSRGPAPSECGSES